MTERVTNVEIEDVLSAIRRLVSEGNPPGARARVVPLGRTDADLKDPDAKDADAACPDRVSVAADALVDGVGPGPLVLTQAFRVVAAPAGAAPTKHAGAGTDADAASAPQTETPLPPELAQDPSTEDVSADPGPDPALMSCAPSQTIAAEAGDDTILSDDVLDLPFDFRSDRDMARADEPPALSDFSTVEGAAIVDAAAETGATSQNTLPPELRLAEMAAELELATCRTQGDWEPDGSETVPEMDWTAAREGAEHGPVPVFRTRKMPPLQLSPALSVAARSAVEGKVDGPGRPVAFHSSRARPEEAAAPAADVPEHQIDDAQLRALVLDVVRQELRGPLGERITQNVRKLVRREIFRVLNEINTD
ncbi:MAG: hypothetical protein JJT81_04115 [Rubellimicrobium sp.]|nr:hypothetical protein [Rubellimicrobium sp.]